MYYVDCNIVLQEAALKNRISLSNKLVFSGGGQQACKDHSKKSMIYMTEILSNENMLHGIKKAVYDDLADSKLTVNGLGIMKTQEPPLTRVVQTFAKAIIDRNVCDWRFDYELNLKVMKIIQQGI